MQVVSWSSSVQTACCRYKTSSLFAFLFDFSQPISSSERRAHRALANRTSLHSLSAESVSALDTMALPIRPARQSYRYVPRPNAGDEITS